MSNTQKYEYEGRCYNSWWALGDVFSCVWVPGFGSGEGGYWNGSRKKLCRAPLAPSQTCPAKAKPISNSAITFLRGENFSGNFLWVFSFPLGVFWRRLE